jgi:tripartite-type tricarboxylate transporter receptor subunit TctC
LPKNTPADRRDYIAAVVEAVVTDPDAQRDFAQAGVLMDPSLNTGDAVRAAAQQLFAAQLRFMRESGRAPQ